MGSSINISDCYICGTGTATACKSEYCQDMHQMLMKSGNPAAKKLLEGFDAETNFSGVITWDWLAKVVRNDDYVEVPKALFNDSDLNDIDNMCETHIQNYAVLDLENGEAEMGLETSLGDTLLILTWSFDYDSLKAIKANNPRYGAEEFEAPTGYNESGPRPFYGNPRKMALDRWGNRRFIRRRKDGTYMKNVDVGRSLAMDRRRQSQTWAPAGFRDQGDGSPSLLVRLLDMFRGVDEEVLMAESYLMCADCDDYSSECGCHNSESDAYIYAYNDGHTDARRDGSYRPSTTDREITSFKKIFKQ